MIPIEDPSQLKDYVRSKCLQVFPEMDQQKAFYRSFIQAKKDNRRPNRIFITLGVEGEPSYTPGETARNQMVCQMAILDLVSGKDNFEGQEQAQTNTYRLSWEILQAIFQDYAEQKVRSFKVNDSRIVPLESEDLPDYYGSLLVFRVTGLSATQEPFY